VIVGIVLACALVLLGVVHLIQDQGSSPQAGAHPKSSDPAAGRSSPVTIKPSPTADLETPGSFAGDWSGRVTQPPNSYTVTISLTQGASTGTVRYSGPNLSCAGTLSLTGVTARKLTLSQRVTRGPCLGGTVALTRNDASSVLFAFAGSGPAATGTLTKS
jgi:hypothetical protein